MSHQDPKHPLSIRLTEPVVFLRGSPDAASGRRRQEVTDASPAMLRGLLSLHLTKPTRVSSIEIMLEGKSTIQWSEGSGPRRVDFPEEHKILKANTVLFTAKTCASSTRSASLGPGTRRSDDESDEPVDNSHHVRSRLSFDAIADPFFAVQRTPSLSVPPPERRNSADQYGVQQGVAPLNTTATLSTSHPPTPPASPPYTPERVSATFADAFVSRPHTPTDPHPDSSTQPHAYPRGFRTEENPGQMLEEFRNALRMEIDGSRRPTPSRTPSGPSPRSSDPALVTEDDSALSAHSIADTSPRSESAPASRSASRSASRDIEHREPRSPAMLNGRTASPSTPPASVRSPRTPLSPYEHEYEHGPRGRHSLRWSLSNMSNVLKDVKDRVRSRSPMDTERLRGRTSERSAGAPNADPVVPPEEHEREGRRREKEHKSALGKLSAAVGLDEAAGVEGWTEFRKGTYTYPISFAIPANTPPTVHCDFGTVTYRLKAVVHRPGALTTKLAISTEVILVACPPDDGTEDTHSIIVERQWDSQLRYVIALSGRSFPIGGKVPFNLTMVPLEKCKVYRLSVFLEEKTEYFARTSSAVREQPIKRFELLSIRHSAEKNAPPILPLTAENASLFTPYLDTSSLSSSADEALTSLMGPGPWALTHTLQIPPQCGRIRFTYKHKESHISISHMIKIVFRVERGDDTCVDPKTGKRRLFDIVVQTPIQILSCHCNREQIALPQYSLFATGTDGVDCAPARTCACSGGTASMTGTRTSTSSGPMPSTSRPSTADAFARANLDAALANSSYQFARLVSGQESVRGEAPPEYTEVLAQA